MPFMCRVDSARFSSVAFIRTCWTDYWTNVAGSFVENFTSKWQTNETLKPYLRARIKRKIKCIRISMQNKRRFQFSIGLRVIWSTRTDIPTNVNACRRNLFNCSWRRKTRSEETFEPEGRVQACSGRNAYFELLPSREIRRTRPRRSNVSKMSVTSLVWRIWLCPPTYGL